MWVCCSLIANKPSSVRAILIRCPFQHMGAGACASTHLSAPCSPRRACMHMSGHMHVFIYQRCMWDPRLGYLKCCAHLPLEVLRGVAARACVPAGLGRCWRATPCRAASGRAVWPARRSGRARKAGCELRGMMWATWSPQSRGPGRVAALGDDLWGRGLQTHGYGDRCQRDRSGQTGRQ